MKNLLLLSLVFVISISLTNCGIAGWSEGAKEDFVQRCINQAKQANIDEVTGRVYCECALEKTMEEYESPIDAWNADEKVMDKIAEDCAQAAPAE